MASIRYFGDCERFSAISSVTAEKLQALHTRIKHVPNASTNGSQDMPSFKLNKLVGLGIDLQCDTRSKPSKQKFSELTTCIIY